MNTLMQEEVVETRRPSRRSHHTPSATTRPHAAKRRSSGGSYPGAYTAPRGNGPDGTTARRRASIDPRFIVALVAIVAIIAAIAIGTVSCAQKASNSQEPLAVTDSATTPASSQQTLVLNDAVRGEAPASGVPERFLNCEETTDENGIVHGTTPDGINYTVAGRGELAQNADRVTLCAIGDQLVTEYALPFADAYAGKTGDGKYDFTPWYREVKPFIQEHDLRFVNQETVMVSEDKGYSYSGYPTFNSPESAAASIADTGFNLVNFTTNHTYDLGTFGIEESHKVWSQYPQLLVGGSYLTQEDRETVHMIERNGLTFAFLAYTYGDNAFSDPSQMPNNYYSCAFDKDAIKADVERAQKVADAVIVAMHWGTEYVNEPNEQQAEYAKFLADLDVDLVLGTHCHTIQPVEYVTGDSGNTIPVAYGLSDFISCWTITDTIISGIFTCDFVPQEDGSVAVENLEWHPTIEWDDGSGEPYVRMLANMDETTTNANTRTPDVANDYTYLRDLTNSVIGNDAATIMWE